MHTQTALTVLLLIIVVMLIISFYFTGYYHKAWLTLIVGFSLGCLLGYFLRYPITPNQYLGLGFAALILVIVPRFLFGYQQENINVACAVIGYAILGYILSSVLFDHKINHT